MSEQPRQPTGQDPQNLYQQEHYPPSRTPVRSRPRRSVWSAISGTILVVVVAIWAYNHYQSTHDTQPCTSGSCAVSTIERTLDGSSARDGAVFTSVSCSPSSLTDVGSGTWRADCTAHYSDGTKAGGYGTLNVPQNLVDFEPTQAP
jgi:hypothetical protein